MLLDVISYNVGFLFSFNLVFSFSLVLCTKLKLKCNALNECTVCSMCICDVLCYSAGCGRTGTLLAIDFVRNLLKYDMITDEFSVMDILTEMRKQRQSLVQTPVSLGTQCLC